jgi:hypothetical protein
MRWSGIKNGPLLEKMRQERFNVFITGDRNLQFQQHLPASGVAVVVLRAGRMQSSPRRLAAVANRPVAYAPQNIRIRVHSCRFVVDTQK